MITAIRTNEHNSDEERRITRKEETLCRLYGLLHDVPHVPFGHTIEDELGILERHDKNKERIEHFFGLKSEIGQIIIREYGKEVSVTRSAVRLGLTFDVLAIVFVIAGMATTFIALAYDRAVTQAGRPQVRLLGL
jgi:dGTP triphosphohydrolase